MYPACFIKSTVDWWWPYKGENMLH